jgi:putative ABC transport system permease protein
MIDRALRALFALCLRAQPAAILESHRADMLETFAALCGRTRFQRGGFAAIRTGVAECLDVLTTGVAARSRGRRPILLMPPPSTSTGLNIVPTLNEVTVAVRRLAKQPLYSGIVVLVLTLGIGVNTVVFSIADGLLLRGVPYPNAARLVELFNSDGRGAGFPGLQPDAFAEWGAQTELFERLEGFAYGSFGAAGSAEPEILAGARVTPGLFPMLGVSPQLGRLFDPGEGVPGRDHVVILSDRLWERYFGADPLAIGRDLTLNDQRYEVVGVMPRGFRFPAGPQDLWIPQAIGAAAESLEGLAMLPPGVDRTVAQRRVDTMAAALEQSKPRPRGWKLMLMPFRGDRVNDTTKRALQILLGAVGLVLLVACANVANLFLAQAIVRQRELSIRAALGASRWRLMRELLVEGVILAACGGLLGTLLSVWGVRAALTIAPETQVRWSVNVIGLNHRALIFTAAATILTGLLFAILPALRGSRTDTADALKVKTTAAAGSQGRVRGALVIAEVALSVVLLVGAALLIRSFMRLQAVDVGFETENLLKVTVSLPTDKYPRHVRQEFFANLEAAVRTLPGVRAVSAANGLPGGGSIHFGEIQAEGTEADTKLSIIPGASVAPGYFDAVGIPILAGRTFGPDDTSQSAVVSQSLAARLRPDGSAVGSRFRLGSSGPWRTVIGVATEVRQEHLWRASRSSAGASQFAEYEIYFPLWPKVTTPPASRSGPVTRDFNQLVFVVRGDSVMSAVPGIKTAIWTLDSTQPIGEISLASHELAEHLAERRFALTLMAMFAALALVLSVAGLYAVLSQIVVQRRHEIGVRMALGARSADVQRLILARGMALVAIGLAGGLAGAWSLSRYLANQLYEISPRDPGSFAIVTLALIAAALLACWVPTRRALAIEPAVALRE